MVNGRINMFRNLLLQQDNFPNGYESVPYIKNILNAYINTLVEAKGNIKFSITLSITQYGNINCGLERNRGYAPIIGARGESSAVVWNAKPQTITLQGIKAPNINEITTISGNFNNINISKQILLFGLQSFNLKNVFNDTTDNGIDVRKSLMALYSCKIYQNDILVRDFIPVKRIIDSKLGLYDKVEHKFYTSPNGADFVL